MLAASFSLMQNLPPLITKSTFSRANSVKIAPVPLATLIVPFKVTVIYVLVPDVFLNSKRLFVRLSTASSVI